MTKRKRRAPQRRTVKLEATLIANLVELQKIHAHLAEKIDGVTTQLTTLLRLFESAAQSFAQHVPIVTDKDKEFLDKIDRLLDQNKTIARGLVLMEERVRERVSPPQQYIPQQMQQPEQPRPLPRV